MPSDEISTMRDKVTFRHLAHQWPLSRATKPDPFEQVILQEELMVHSAKDVQ